MMKKMLVLGITLLMGMSLAGCTIATQDDVDAVQDDVDAIVSYDDQAIRDQIAVIQAALESQAADKEKLQEDLELVDKNTKFYAVTTLSQLSDAEDLIAALTTELETAQSEIDALEAELATLNLTGGSDVENNDYIYDNEGNYISGVNMLSLLIDKYFGLESEDLDNCSEVCIYFQSEINFSYDTSELIDVNDLFAKYILMVNELRMYKYYYDTKMSVNMSFYNDIDENNWQHFFFNISLSTLLNNDFSIDVHAIYNEMYDIRFDFDSVALNEEAIQAAYDAYVTAGTYDGYVLDFE